MKPTISVIMPFYNRADLLAETLDSILAQTYSDFELIGVDDGSTDDAPKIFKSYAARDQRLQLYTKPHTNAGDARNLGYEHSRGEYLFFLDSDDLIEPDFFATMLNAIQQEHSDIAMCTSDEFDHHTKATIRVRNFKGIKLSQPITTLTPADLQSNIFNVTPPPTWNKIFTRTLIEQHYLRFQSLISCNDMYFSFAALIYASRITFIDRILIHRRVHDQRSLSAIGNLTVNKFTHCLALDYLRQQLPTEFFTPLATDFYFCYLQSSLNGIIHGTFMQGYQIFTHTRIVLLDHMDIYQTKKLNLCKLKYIAALTKNKFVPFYRWLRKNNALLFFDPTADERIKQLKHWL